MKKAIDPRIRIAVEQGAKGAKIVDARPSEVFTEHKVCAGALGDYHGAALYLKEDHAILAYNFALRDFIKKQKANTIRFAKGPVIESWHMTRSDSSMTHRVVDQRFTISSTIEIFD